MPSALVVSLLLHAMGFAALVPLVAAAQARRLAEAEQANDASSDSVLLAAPPLETITLGLDDGAAEGLVWIGHPEFQEQLARVSETEQAAFESEPMGGAAGVDASAEELTTSSGAPALATSGPEQAPTPPPAPPLLQPEAETTPPPVANDLANPPANPPANAPATPAEKSSEQPPPPVPAQPAIPPTEGAETTPTLPPPPPAAQPPPPPPPPAEQPVSPPPPAEATAAAPPSQPPTALPPETPANDPPPPTPDQATEPTVPQEQISTSEETASEALAPPAESTVDQPPTEPPSNASTTIEATLEELALIESVLPTHQMLERWSPTVASAPAEDAEEASPADPATPTIASPPPQPESAPPSPPPAASTPASPSSAPPGPPRDRPADGDPSDRESDATSLVDVPPDQWRRGKPLATRGLDIRTKRPIFPELTRLTARPGSPIVEIFFDRTGVPKRAAILRSSGDPRIDGPLVDSLYRWRASGAPLARLRDGETVRIEMRILLGDG